MNALMNRLRTGVVVLSPGDIDTMANAIHQGLSAGIRQGLDVDAGAKALLRLHLPHDQLLKIARDLTSTIHDAMLDDRPASILSHGRMLIALGIKGDDLLGIFSATTKLVGRPLMPIELAITGRNGEKSSLSAIRAYGHVLKLHGLPHRQVISLLESRDRHGASVLYACIQELASYLPNAAENQAIEKTRRLASVVHAFTEVLLEHRVPREQIVRVIGPNAVQRLYRKVAAAGRRDLAKTCLELIEDAYVPLLNIEPVVRRAMYDKAFANSINQSLALQSIARRWQYAMPQQPNTGPGDSVDF